MSCEETTALLVARLNGQVSTDEGQRLDAHLEGCTACREEAATTTALWRRLGTLEVDVPHERLRARFHAALAEHEARESRAGSEGPFARWWPRQPAFQVALAAALALVGVLIGQRLPSPADSEIAALRDEVRVVGLALLDHQSAAERLLGVAWARRAAQSPEVASALLERVQYDSNSSVRLAAVEALRSELDRPEVGAGLALALARQESPLLQVALSDALLAAGSAPGVEAVRGLLGRAELDPSVREYLQMALNDTGAENLPANTDI
jgi:anti-sigma factor RsiW